LKLLFIALTNPLYNLGLGLCEAFYYGRYLWWWRLRGLLFLFYLVDSPFTVVKREGRRAPVRVQNLIYGETPCLTIRRILDDLKPNANDHFVDLGCGRGLALLFVRLWWNIPVTGIEVVPTFITRARKIANMLRLDRVELIQENLAWVMREQIEMGTIFYLAGTAFEDEQMIKIASRLEMLPAGIRLITLSEPLASDLFRVTGGGTCHFSWGKTEVYYHEKIG
jgi:hypothetical protein